MSIDDIISELHALLDIRVIGAAADRMDELFKELVRRFGELENRDEERREMMRNHTHSLMRKEVGYKPRIGKSLED